MPYLIGKPLAQAAAELGDLGLAWAATPQFSATIPAGEVIAQAPAFGTPVLPGVAPPAELAYAAGPPLAGPVARIVVEPGTASRRVGETLALKATAIFADETSADVTLAAQWSSTAPAVAAVDAGGARPRAHRRRHLHRRRVGREDRRGEPRRGRARARRRHRADGGITAPADGAPSPAR